MKPLLSWLTVFRDDPLRALNQVPLVVWVVVTALGAILLSLEPSQGQSNEPLSLKPQASSLDTFIPRGYVLIPIELENYNSVDSILGSYGVVDLYLSRQNYHAKAKPLARRIKILRAPQNPSQFAVLVPEGKAGLFFQQESVFFAAILNPKESGTEFENKAKPRKQNSPRSMIIFEKEDV